MITLYSYPTLFGVADNNGYGLKVFAFLRLVGLPFVHEHIFDASAAPRGQLPYMVDDGETIGDSETILAHLIGKYSLGIGAALGQRERDLSLLITRMLDDLYWVMSYSRWKDERYWPSFRDALMREHPSLTEDGLLKAREFNFQRYHFQGIGRYAPEAAYARGLADLKVLADLVPADAYVHGRAPTSVDAGLRLHRQHLVLRHRYAAQGVCRLSAEPGAPLHRHPRGGDAQGGSRRLTNGA
jgi:Glutathione S-transferase N-terminal domain